MSQQSLDYREHLILFVDDEQKTRKYFAKLFGKTFRVVLAEDGVNGLERFREYQDEIGVVVTDQRMPNETGSEFLEKVALLKPSVVRILSTAYADIDAAVDSVNKGGIYRYITKPWEVPELEVTLKRAMELYMVRLEREELVRQKMMSVEILAASDRIVSLAALSMFQNSGLRRVGEALKAVVRLSEEQGERPVTERGIAEGLSWRELYRRHLSFLGTVSASLPPDLTSPENLGFDERCAVRDVLDPIVASSGGKVVWNEPRATPPDWPGPVDAMQSVVRPFIDTLSDLVGSDGNLQFEEVLSGLEIGFPGRPVRQVLQPMVSSSGEEPSRPALDLIGSLIRMAHHGGMFDFLPDPNRSESRLRIGFDVSRVERAPEDGYEELAADLVGNELFWSRYVE
ncbi:MAG: response regulator [Akkermansiaceae bacterium]|nr:response regulator [Akkermansiaceae bacterium]